MVQPLQVSHARRIGLGRKANQSTQSTSMSLNNLKTLTLGGVVFMLLLSCGSSDGLRLEVSPQRDGCMNQIGLRLTARGEWDSQKKNEGQFTQTLLPTPV